MSLRKKQRFMTNLEGPEAVKRPPFEPGREWRTVNAIHRKELPMPQKSLLIAIAKHESRRHRFCFAGIRTLAVDVGCDVKTARCALHDLSEKKIIRVKNVRGSSSRVVIDWKRFEKLPSATPTKSGRGVSQRRPLPKVGEVPLPNVAGGTPPKSGTQGVKKYQGGEPRAVSVVFEKQSGEKSNHHHPKTDDDNSLPVDEKPNRFAVLQDRARDILVETGEDRETVELAIEWLDERAATLGKTPVSPQYYVACFESLKANAEEWQMITAHVNRRRALREKFMSNFTAELTPEMEQRRRAFLARRV
jgi:hypothetical protein